MHNKALIIISILGYLSVLILANMQFPLPDASIVLWFLHLNQRLRALRETLTQKAFDNKREKPY